MTRSAVEIFNEAREMPAPERAGYLKGACDDVAMCAKVESLLKADAEAGGFMASPTGNATVATLASASAPTIVLTPREHEGQMIGRYKLLQPIGEGGFGSVWMAEQREPVKRRVALKIIKLGMDTRQVIARFEAERQALAMMDHPNIAKVLDAGSTETGRPYFVMEYIKGVPILEYCDTEKIDTKARLELFTQVCHAIQHAHQKGIIHRDIKPSNVLVTMHDGVPVPKVIDFGIAKATSSELTNKTLFTEHRQMIGTPAYMSPEQAEMSGLDIDTRSDIYSLGVLLYELLTGTTPFDSKELMSKGFAEMMRIIREVEPHKPSTRLSSLGETGTRTALQRHAVDPKKLGQTLKGDLDWIVMKCIEKDRTRRYETANGLAADIKRHLKNEPVTAGAPSSAYRLKKFVRRNKGQVIAASLVLFVLLAGFVGTAWGLVEANRARSAERDRAESERIAKLDAQAKEKLAVEAKEKEREARLEEERQRKFAEGISRFVQDDFLALTSVEGQDRFGGVGKETLSKDSTLHELLDRAAEKLKARKDLDPQIEAELSWIIGVNYRASGEAKKAIRFLKRAVKLRTDLFGRDQESTLFAMNSLAVAYQQDGKFDMAVQIFEETVALDMQVLGPEDFHTLFATNNLASAYRDNGQNDQSVKLLEGALEVMKAKLGPENRLTLASMDNLANAYMTAGPIDKAVSLLEETQRLRIATLGPEHPDTFEGMGSLATAYHRAGKDDKAIPLLEDTLRLQQARLGREHPSTQTCMGLLASAYRTIGKNDKAVALYEEVLELRKGKISADHPGTLILMKDLGEAYKATGRADLAVPLLEEMLKLTKIRFGPEHPDTLAGMYIVAMAYQAAGRFDLAVSLFEEELKIKKAAYGSEDTKTLATMNHLALAYQAAGKLDEAIALFEETLLLTKANLGPEHPDTIQITNNLAMAYQEAGKLDRAIPLFKDALNIARKTLPADSPKLGDQLAWVCLAMLENSDFAEAEPYLRECVLIREKAAPDAWSTFNARSMLGGALLGQKKLDEAEPLLLDGYRGMKQREATMPKLPQARQRIPQALERLVQLYEAKGDDTEAAKWQSKLDAAKALQTKPDAKTRD